MIVLMEAPPAYTAPKKKMSTCLIVVIACAVLGILCCGGIAMFGYYMFGQGKPLMACQQEFGDLRQSFLDYVDAHDGKLPKATTWMDDVRPYYKKLAAQHTDEQKVFGAAVTDGAYQCNRGGSATAIVFNSDLGGKLLKSVKDPEDQTLIFESSAVPALNLAQKYSPQDTATSPVVMNKHVGWFSAPLSGDVKLGGKKFRSSRQGGVQITTGD